CHSSAVNGDTITVSSGSYATSANIIITKYVKIIASGTVTVTDNSCPSVAVCQSDNETASMLRIYESPAGNTRLPGFKFVMGSAVHLNPHGVVRIDYQSGAKPVIIDHNSYTTDPSTLSGDFIIITSNRGVISNNTMTSFLAGSNCLNQASFVRQYA